MRSTGASATCSWKPLTQDNYIITVYAWDLSGPNPGQPVVGTLPFSIVADLSGVSLSVSPPSPATSQNIITLTATPTNGANVIYQFSEQPGPNAPWVIFSPYGSTATTTWSPPGAGTYTLQVQAKDANGTFPNQVYTATSQPYTVYAPLTGVALTANPPSPQTTAQKNVTLTAKPNGGHRICSINS